MVNVGIMETDSKKEPADVKEFPEIDRTQILPVPQTGSNFTSFDSDITENEDDDQPLIKSGNQGLRRSNTLTEATVNEEIRIDKQKLYARDVLNCDMSSSIDSDAAKELLITDADIEQLDVETAAYHRLSDTESQLSAGVVSDDEQNTPPNPSAISQISEQQIKSLTRPGDLSLPKPLQQLEDTGRVQSTDISEYSELINTPLQGTVEKHGDMVEFVAEDLQEKIKLSSPVSRQDTSGSEGRHSRTPSLRTTSSSNYSISSNSSIASSSTWSTNAGMSRSPSRQQNSPIDIPPIDPGVLVDLEEHAKRVADSLDLMMGSLRTNLHRMSAITVGCQTTYKDAVDKTCDSADASIKSMYALMAKCEELYKNTQPITELHEQIKEIKRLLDMFETQVATHESA